MFMVAKSSKKMLIFEQGLFSGHFMGENLRKNLAQDSISGKILRFRPMFAQNLIISLLAKILPGGGEIISHPDSSHQHQPQRPECST